VATNHEELARYLGTEAATRLLKWAELTQRVITVPAQEWRRRGFTDALLVQLFIDRPGESTRLVVAKLLPPGQTAEPGRHARAVSEAPGPFRRHLVEQVYEPVFLDGGGVVMFQGLAGDSEQWRPLGSMPPTAIPGACETVARSLIAEWNPDFTVKVQDLVEFLHDDIGDTGSVRRHLVEPATLPADTWLRPDGDPPVPNPALLVTEASIFGGERINAAFGRVHSDLHALNVLLRQRRNQGWPDSFVLVDLMTYQSSGQLGRDLVRLLLSVTGLALGQLTPAQRTALLARFVRPETPAGPVSFPVDALDAVYSTAAAELSRAGRDVWRRQFLLSLVTQGLIMTTFESFPPAARWWYYRVAGHAARELVGEFHPSIAVPADAPQARNPFDPRRLPPHHRTTYTQIKKRRVCREIRDDWSDLADLLRIPNRDRDRSWRGRQAWAIWAWLEARGRLSELPGALRALGRDDLADLLEG
jgi:hypothetical protein